MKSLRVVACLSLILFARGSPAPGEARDGGASPDRMLLALELMDLEIPGEDVGGEMELPPIPGDGRPEEKPGAVQAGEAPPEGAPAETGPPVETAFPQPAATEIDPFLLEGGGPWEGAVAGEEGEAERERAAAEAGEGNLPADLKTVQPPPSHAEGLKLPGGREGDIAGRPEVPEIPLLKGLEGEPQAPLPHGGDASLTMKPVSETGGMLRLRPTDASPGAERRPQDYLLVHDPIDDRLIDLYERYYEDR